MSTLKKSNDYLYIIKFFIEGFAFVIGVSYALGFIVVNTYLTGYGVVEFELLKVKYVSTGFLLFFLLVIYASFLLPRILIDKSKGLVYADQIFVALSSIVYVTTFLLFSILFITEKNIKFTSYKSGILRYVYVLPMLSVFFSVIVHSIKNEERRRKIARIASIVSVIAIISWHLIVVQNSLKYLTLWALGYFIVLFNAFSPYFNSDDSHDPDLKVKDPRSLAFRINWSRIGYSFCLFLILIIYFGKYIYPLIDPAVGGGKPRNVILMPHKGKVEEFEQLISNNEVQLINNSNKYLYVISQDTDSTKIVIQLDKKLILGIKYKKLNIKDK